MDVSLSGKQREVSSLSWESYDPGNTGAGQLSSGSKAGDGHVFARIAVCGVGELRDRRIRGGGGGPYSYTPG
jgi:hypothetical protein